MNDDQFVVVDAVAALLDCCYSFVDSFVAVITLLVCCCDHVARLLLRSRCSFDAVITRCSFVAVITLLVVAAAQAVYSKIRN